MSCLQVFYKSFTKCISNKKQPEPDRSAKKIRRKNSADVYISSGNGPWVILPFH